jgi:hypothetical protein
LPASNSATSTTPSTSGISTTKANTLIMAGIGSADVAYLTGPDVTGWTVWAGTENVGGCCFASNRTESKIFGTIQSSATVSYGATGSGPWAMIVDALQDASQPAAAARGLMFKSGPGW